MLEKHIWFLWQKINFNKFLKTFCFIPSTKLLFIEGWGIIHFLVTPRPAVDPCTLLLIQCRKTSPRSEAAHLNLVSRFRIPKFMPRFPHLSACRELCDTFTNIILLRIFPLWNIYSWKMLRKLKWQLPGDPLATRYNWC